MHLRLTVVTLRGRRDVVVAAEPGTSVADVAAALAGVSRPRSAPGSPVPVDLLARAAARRGRPAAAATAAAPALLRGAQVLDPTASLEASGLLDGDVVHVEGQPDEGAHPTREGLARGPARWEAHVLSGPDTGGVHLLPSGVSVVGRGGMAEVTLDDPAADREHLLLDVGPDTACAEDLGGGVLLDGEPLLGQTSVAPGAVLQVGSTRLRLVPAGGADAAVAPDGAGGLAYNRPPRIRPAVGAVRISLPAPPRVAEGPRFNVIAILAPVAFGVTLAVALQQPRFLLFTMLAPLMVLGNYVSDRRYNRKKRLREAAEHAEALAAVQGELAEAVTRQQQQRLHATPGPSEVLLQAVGPRRRLWERRADDDDVLALRLGLADQPSSIVLVERGQPEGTSPPVLEQVPVVLALAELGVIGVAGPREAVSGTARWLVAQLAVLHSPRDVRVCVLADDPLHAEADWDWLRWLPHVRPSDEPTAPLLIGAGDAGTSQRVAELVALVTARTRAAEQARAGERVAVGERVVVVLDGARALRGLTGMPQVLQDGPAVGVHALCLDAQERLLPEECRAIAVHGPVGGAVGLTVSVTAGAVHDDVVADEVSVRWAERLSRALAPLRDTSRDDDDAGLPAALRLLDELGLEPPSAHDVRAGWATGGRSTRAVLGRSVEGPFAVDLREDGPHALVAGTTGAGKSELLQTMIASLAVANRPDALTFVLVDYKGGSAFKDCARLPHTVGMVTDLDGHLTERALASLTAELKRRETILAGSGAKDVEDHWAARDAGLAADPMPRLVIVIDEFASLVEELPEFVRGLVGIAQRGRSLGVHLVLATQRPGGVVSPEIRANTNLRIALRVTDPSESSDVVDAPDAARISRSTPGRGYVRTGHASLTAFQAARVGGRRPGVVAAMGPDVLELPFAQLGFALPVRRRADVDEDETTDLSALVDAVSQAARETTLAPLTRPWLPPLPDELVLDDLPSDDPVLDDPLRIPFGRSDLPGSQQQGAAVLDLVRGGHLLLCGAPRSGRSTALRTLAGSIARRTSSADVHVHALDCGNGALLPLAGLPHVGAVVTRDQPDRVARLLDRLWDEVSRRQELLATAGHADLAEQRDAVPASDRLPYLVLLLDRWEGFTQEFQDVDGGRLVEAFLRLLREGPGVGLRVVVAADRSGLLGRLSSAVEDRAVLRLADRNDYGLAGMQVRAVPEHVPPGRCFRGDDLVETQVALLVADPNGSAQVAALQVLARDATARDADLPRSVRPFRVDALPRRLTTAEADGLPGGLGSATPTTVLVGVGGDELSRLELDVGAEGPAFVIGGPPRSGRSTALLVMAESALARGASIVAVLPRRSPVRALAGRPGVLGVLDAAATASDLRTLLDQAEGPVVLAVDDGELLADAPVAEVLVAFLKQSRDGAGALLLAGTTEDLAGVYRGFAVDARKSRLGLLLAPASTLDGELLSVKLPRSTGGAYPAGRGLLVVRGEWTAVQVPAPE